MIECEKCNYDNNPPDESNCLYCKAKLNTVEVLTKSKRHYDFLSGGLGYLEVNDVQIGELTVTDQNHMLYRDINKVDAILRINPIKFSNSYYENGWFSISNSLPSNYKIRDTAQTRKDIILVFLKRHD